MNKTVLSTVLALMTAGVQAADVNGSLPMPPTPDAATTQSATSTALPAAAMPTTVDCSYHIPPNQTTIDPTIITAWAEKATLQAFSFNPADIDNQMNTLKTCFTDQGWKGFSDALEKSGNISSIKSQQLNVSSQVDGEKNINTIKDNQWKVTLPLQVVYQNDKEKVTQHLKVDVLVGRKINGDLGIMQMIAITKPSDTMGSAAPTQATTETTTPSQQSMPASDVNTTPETTTPTTPQEPEQKPLPASSVTNPQ